MASISCAQRGFLLKLTRSSSESAANSRIIALMLPEPVIEAE